MKELLKKAFHAGMSRQWSIHYQEDIKTRPSFEEWYKEHESEVLALHNIVGQSEQLSCDTCKLKCDTWDDDHPCATCCEFDNYQAT